MNNALTVVLIFAILLLAGVLAVQNRYAVVEDTASGTIIIDQWGDFKTPRIIQKNEKGTWVLLEVLRGGESVLRFESGMDAEPEIPERPEI
jgi:hypothetical protein